MSDSKNEFTGQIVNNSRSSNAPGIRMRSLWFVWNYPLTRIFAQLCLFILFILLPAAIAGQFMIDRSGSRPLEVLGGILLAAGNLGLLALILVGILLSKLCKNMSIIFREGLLTPGVIVSESPLEFVAITNMSTGFGPDYEAVKRFPLERLPASPAKVGTRLACVSTFKDGPRDDVWGNFETELLNFATGNRAILNSMLERIGPDGFARLETAISKGEIPEKVNELHYLDPLPD